MRKLIILFGCCTFILLAGYGGYRGYRVWKQKHLLSLAQGFLAKSDGRNAVLSLQGALRVNPLNLQANRLMAEIAEASRSPSALIWRSRVVAISRNSTPDRLALAKTALMFRDYPSATNALEGMDADGKKTAAYHNLAGAAAMAVNKLDEAEMHYLEASHLEPTNPVPQLNLAVVLLQSSNTLSQAQARSSLERIATDPKFIELRCNALRDLVSDAIRNNQIQTAETLTLKLLAQTNSVFTDRLLRLNVLQQAKSASFNSELAAYQREAAADPAKVYEMATWQLAHKFAAEALAWLQSLPKESRNSQGTLLLMAECRTVVQDWSGLQTSLQQQNWGELEFLRHAFLTRALRGENLTSAATGEWELALRDAKGQKQSLNMLLNLAAQWNYSAEVQGILWTFVNQFPEERAAYQALGKLLLDGGQTRPLMLLFSKELKRYPEDLGIKNGLAMVALLLDAKEEKPDELAQEIYQKSPTNSAYASTYAFSLYLKKKNVEALTVMSKLDSKALQTPAISGYYGLILKANGRAAEAKPFFDLSAKASYLPEERKLIDVARNGT